MKTAQNRYQFHPHVEMSKNSLNATQAYNFV
jgi:hypothetical protein